MKLSGMKLSDAQNATDQVDASHTLIRLVIIWLSPFVFCLIILLVIPGLSSKLLIDSLRTAAILWAGGGALSAAFYFLEEREGGEQATLTRRLLLGGLTLLVMIVVPALITWLS